MKKMEWWQWRDKELDRVRDELGNGRGVIGAFDSGAEARLRSTKYDNSYQRSDMQQAYYKGWKRMDNTMKSGTIIICKCCGQDISLK